VVRFAILLYGMFVLFLALMIGPSVVGQNMEIDIEGILGKPLNFRLVQPTGLDNDNTNGTTYLTGTGMDGYTGYAYTKSLATASSDGNGRPTDKIKLF
jgi:hypothetical protein